MIQILYNPKKVFLLSVTALVTAVLLNGGLYRLLGLRAEEKQLRLKIDAEKAQILMIDQKLRQAKDPGFIERQAKERLELIEKDDLLFIFSED